MYSNTKVGDYLAESNPKTLKVQPGWAKSLGGEVNTVADKIKITGSGEEILSGTFENFDHYMIIVPLMIESTQILSEIIETKYNEDITGTIRAFWLALT